MQIIYLTQSGPDLPSVRFRVLPFVTHAQNCGHKACWKRIPKAIHKRLAFVMGLPTGCIIVIQKKLLSGLPLAILKKKASLLVFDFDDALWTSHPSVPDSSKKIKDEIKNSKLLQKICAEVDLVIAGNNYLAKKIENAAKDILIAPTPLDTDKYTPAESPATRNIPRVGWMGTSCNLFFLPRVFKAITTKLPNTELYVVSDKPLPKELAPMATFEKWEGEHELHQLRKMDIGLMPLTDDEYTRGKCGFKILQYMACGVVPIASDVGFNREIIVHGQNGFLINEGEWAKYVEKLATDHGLIKKMANEARKSVVEKFSLDAIANRVWKKLESKTSHSH